MRQRSANPVSAALPDPDRHAIEHSERLVSVLSDHISTAGGLIPFSDFMRFALYEPGLGYYMAGAAKFGVDGDFITAPEVSDLFGQSIGVQVNEVLETLGGGVLELGAGSGRLALGILQSIALPSDFRYTILEPSAELAQRQRQLLSERLSRATMDRVRWVSSLPVDFTGAIIANEVIDALPVERFRAGVGLERMYVCDKLEAHFLPAHEPLLKSVAHIETDIGFNFTSGYTSEICLLLEPWLHSLHGCLTQGVILLADYGYPRHEYYLPERVTGTLACYYRHRSHDDPFFFPGIQDITAHVDFTAVAQSAVDAGLELLGYASQSAFLRDNALLELADTQCREMSGEAERIALAQAVKKLTLPGEMGERFQVMALGKRYDSTLRGFCTQDLSHRL